MQIAPGHSSAATNNLTIAELGRLIEEKKISPAEVVKDCLQRIEKLNPMLNAFIQVNAEQAVNQAQIAEAEIRNGNWKGPLHGVPVAVKDMFDTRGARTTAAFEFFKDRIPEKDAEVVTKLKDAGAIVIGKLNMHELAMGTTSVISYFGAVHNPWNTNYIAGGSSGGSAAALAVGMCYATIDTDAIGSCRLPASCCGVTGFKPTFGLLSCTGILAGEAADEMILHLAHTAFMTRTAEDAVSLLNVLSDSEASQVGPKPGSDQDLGTTGTARIGIVKNFNATDEVRKHFLNAAGIFSSLGYAAIDIEAPLEFASINIERMTEDRKTIAESLFKDVEVLILPTTTETTPTIAAALEREKIRFPDDVAFSANNTFFCNYYGLPAISIPCGFDRNRLPLGLQIVGKPFDESKVLEVAGRYQSATRWHLHHPS
jgi:aspartyl-tRNA(Asn)/glutamyl-tRNA(Gln) amidotransferase subunit A